MRNRLEDSKQVSASGDSTRVPLLLIEDDPGMANEIVLELDKLHYDVHTVDTADAGLEALRSHPAALLIMDRLLDGEDSLQIIETLRGRGVNVPILLISSLASVDERIHGLKAGGDDYLTKPFAVGELAARVEALLRRAVDARATNLRVGPLEMDLIERTARRGERSLELLPREFKLLEYFMRRPGQTITRAMLLEDVWHYRNSPLTNVVDVHISNLRRKVDAPGEPRLMETVRSHGFRLHAME
ncbi:MAG: response regulator transcription factor [Beijerinckiaceae bacterium]